MSRSLVAPYSSWLLLCFLSLLANPAAAQMQYATAVSNQSGVILTPTGAVDSNLGTSATLRPTAALTSPSLRVKFTTLATPGRQAGVYLKTDNTLNVSALGTASIRTYLGNQQVESYNIATDVVTLAVQNTDIKNMMFTPTKAFDQIQVDYASLAAVGKDILVYEAYITVAPLPVTLLTFVAQPTLAGVALSWETASEVNSSHFVVERADGSGDDFRALGQVQGAGSSSQARHYSFVDTAPGPVSYYRLRQVDLDGTETFSAVVVAKTEPPALRLAAYPSPTTETLSVTGAAGTSFSILDQQGRLVHRATLPASQQQQVDVRSLPSGTYYVREATGKSLKFVKAATL